MAADSPADADTDGDALGPPPLQRLCEEAVARELVDPRTALEVLEYADLAGASVLRAYCIAVAVCNMDALMLEARPAFEALPLHLMAALERTYKTYLRGASAGKAAGRSLSFEQAAGAPAQPSSAAAVRRPSRGSPLQPGRRPSALPPALGDLSDVGDEGVNAGGEGGPGPAPTLLRPESSFHDQAEHAALRLRRSLAKKLEQIEQLELRAAAGAGLDPQQLAKVAQRPVVVSALAALDGGMPTEDVAALMQAAGEASAGTSRGAGAASSTPGASASKSSKSKGKDAGPAGDSGSGSGAKSRTRSRRRLQSETSVLSAERSTLTVGASPLGVRPFPSLGSSPCGPAVASSSGAGQTAEPLTHIVGFAAGSASKASAGMSSRTGAPSARGSEQQAPRKGALSMFLRGGLDAPAAAAP